MTDHTAISIERLLRPELVQLDIEASSTTELYQAVARRLVKVAKIAESDVEEIVAGLKAREKLGGITLGRGVAIPHCTHRDLTAPRVALVRLKDGLKLKTPDDLPVDLWFVLTGAEGDARSHLQALARLALLLREDTGLAAIRDANSGDAVLQAALDLEARHPLTPAKPGSHQRALFIVLNETGRLHEVIEGLAELGVSGATVVESRGMGNILSEDIPIFAGFRHLLGGSRPFNYTIFSVVPDAELAREAVTMLRDLLSDTDAHPGIAFTMPVDDFSHLTQEEDAKAGSEHAATQ